MGTLDWQVRSKWSRKSPKGVCTLGLCCSSITYSCTSSELRRIPESWTASFWEWKLPGRMRLFEKVRKA